jgi:hypothetical protein
MRQASYVAGRSRNTDQHELFDAFVILDVHRVLHWFLHIAVCSEAAAIILRADYLSWDNSPLDAQILRVFIFRWSMAGSTYDKAICGIQWHTTRVASIVPQSHQGCDDKCPRKDSYQELSEPFP